MESKFNYETWKALSPLAKALIVSVSKKGKYAPSKKDLRTGFYFVFEEANINIEVSLSAIFETNNKLNGILGVKFTSSTDCPSHRLGTCQVPAGTTCYGVQGERQSKAKNDLHGLRGMSGDLNGKLCAYYWDLYKRSPSIRLKFESYCLHYDIRVLRFNNKGDFRNSEDIAVIHHLAKSGIFEAVYGYTARDDLYNDLQALCRLNEDTLTLNGSNIKYTNRFYVTSDLREFLKAKYICRGDCSECGQCRKLRGETIYCLVHGTGSDTVLNNPANCELIRAFSRECLKWDMCNKYNGAFDPTEAKGLSTCFNNVLKREGVILRTPNPKALVNLLLDFKKSMIKKGVI